MDCLQSVTAGDAISPDFWGFQGGVLLPMALRIKRIIKKAQHQHHLSHTQKTSPTPIPKTLPLDRTFPQTPVKLAMILYMPRPPQSSLPAFMTWTPPAAPSSLPFPPCPSGASSAN